MAPPEPAAAGAGARPARPAVRAASEPAAHPRARAEAVRWVVAAARPAPRALRRAAAAAGARAVARVRRERPAPAARARAGAAAPAGWAARPERRAEAVPTGVRGAAPQAAAARGRRPAAAPDRPLRGPSGLRFCDTFESKSVGTFATAAPWVLQGGTVTIDGATPAHSGSKSVRVHATDNDYDTLFVLHDATILPAPNGRFFLRAYMRLSRAMAGGHNAFIIADPYAMQGTGNNVRIGEMNAMLMYTIMGDGHGALSNQNYYNDGKPGVAFTPVHLGLPGGPHRPHAPPRSTSGSTAPSARLAPHGLAARHLRLPVRFGFEKYAGPASTSGTTTSPSGPNVSAVTEAAA